MRYEKAIPQIDGATRYLYACPRGTIAIEDDGHCAELWHCTNGSRLTRRDDRDAWSLHRARIEEEADSRGVEG